MGGQGFPQGGQAPGAGFHQIERLKGFRGLAQVNQHQAAHLRRPLGRQHGLSQIVIRDFRLRLAGHSQFQPPLHHLKLVVKMMGNGPGHPAQAFVLFQLPVPGFQFGLRCFGLLAVSDINHHRQETFLPLAADDLAGEQAVEDGPVLAPELQFNINNAPRRLHPLRHRVLLLRVREDT